MRENVLITGATGFVGINLVKRLLKNDKVHLYLLVRDSRGVSAKSRVEKLLREYFTEDEYSKLKKRLEVIRGDVTEDNLGLTTLEWDNLAQQINTIYHSAASINFKLPIEEAKEININGTERILKLAEQCKKYKVLRRLHHISTAYVVGDSREMFYETELEIGQGFENTYEVTKFEAEKLVNKYIERGLPVTVFRPSVIAGDFYSGEITKSNLIFGFIKQISSSRYRDFICNDDSSLNIIPVDYFIDAVMEISRREESIGKTYHIINNKNSNIKNIVKACCNVLGISNPNFVPIKHQEKVSARTRQLLEVFITYIEKSHTFDDRITRQTLDGTGIVCPEITMDFMERTIAYCKDKKYL